MYSPAEGTFTEIQKIKMHGTKRRTTMLSETPGAHNLGTHDNLLNFLN